MQELGIEIVDISTRLDSKKVGLKSKYKLLPNKSIDWKESVNKNKNNLIVVANKSELHQEISEYCLNQGKFVLCEKRDGK